MKYLKMLGFAAVAAAALMAFLGAGTASASVICSTTADPCPAGQAWPTGTAMDFSLVGSAVLETDEKEPFTLDTCTGGTVKGTLNNGNATTTANGSVTAANLTWSGCTVTTDTKAGGTLEIHKIAGTSNGTVTAKEFTVTVNTILFGSCHYTTGASGVDLGVLTEGQAGTSTLHVNATVTSNAGFCPPTATWTATYELTEPTKTTLSVSAS